MTGKHMTRFDLEQKILDCWGVVDDIKSLYSNLDKLTEDQTQNFLLGLETIYSVKFQECFELFEKLIKDQKI